MSTIKVPLKYSMTPDHMPPPPGSCSGCGLALAWRYCLRVLGDKIVQVSPPGCVVMAPAASYIDSVGSAFGSAAMLAGGIKSALIAQNDTETQVVVHAGDGATFDIGFGGVSASAERNEDILYICCDNEAYQNTGNQRSSATPWLSTNSTNPVGFNKREPKKDIMSLLADHAIPYAATATIGFPDDLMRKVEKAKNTNGFRFIHLLEPCPTGWGFNSNLTINMSRLAVETNVFPLFEVTDGVNMTVNYQPKGTPSVEYLRPQRRFREITDEQVAEFQKNVDRRWKRLLYLAAYKDSN